MQLQSVKNKKQTANTITIIIIFIMMMFLNIRCPYISDDFHFKFVWKDFLPTANDKPVENIVDIFESMKNYYMLSGGRVIPHFITYVFLTFDKMFFNILNSFIFIYLGYLVYSMTVKKKSDSIFYLPFIYLTLFMWLPNFGDDVLWLSGATNYHWTSALFLTAVNYFLKNADSDKKSKTAVLAVLTLLSAATNETTGGMLILLFTVYWLINKKKINSRFIIINICAMISMMTVLFAPGNVNRAEHIEKIKLFDFNGFFIEFAYCIGWLLKGARFCIIFNAILILLYYKLKPDDFNISFLLKKFMLFYIGCIGSIAMIIAGFFSSRTAIHGMFLIIVFFWDTFPECAHMAFVELPERIEKKPLKKLFMKPAIYSVICLCITVLYIGYNLLLYNNGMNDLSNYYSQYMIYRIDPYDAEYTFALGEYGIMYPEMSASEDVIIENTMPWFEQAEKYNIDVGIR